MLTNLPSRCAVVLKTGNLNFLEPSGPLLACNGTDLSVFINTVDKAICFGLPCAIFGLKFVVG